MNTTNSLLANARYSGIYYKIMVVHKPTSLEITLALYQLKRINKIVQAVIVPMGLMKFDFDPTSKSPKTECHLGINFCEPSFIGVWQIKENGFHANNLPEIINDIQNFNTISENTYTVNRKVLEGAIGTTKVILSANGYDIKRHGKAIAKFENALMKFLNSDRTVQFYYGDGKKLLHYSSRLYKSFI